MSAYKIPGLKPKDLDGKLKKLGAAIEKSDPVGFAKHKHEFGLRQLNSLETEHLLTGRIRSQKELCPLLVMTSCFEVWTRREINWELSEVETTLWRSVYLKKTKSGSCSTQVREELAT